MPKAPQLARAVRARRSKITGQSVRKLASVIQERRQQGSKPGHRHRRLQAEGRGDEVKGNFNLAGAKVQDTFRN
jgi:hypothetical protein